MGNHGHLVAAHQPAALRWRRHEQRELLRPPWESCGKQCCEALGFTGRWFRFSAMATLRYNIFLGVLTISWSHLRDGLHCYWRLGILGARRIRGCERFHKLGLHVFFGVPSIWILGQRFEENPKPSSLAVRADIEARHTIGNCTRFYDVLQDLCLYKDFTNTSHNFTLFLHKLHKAFAKQLYNSVFNITSLTNCTNTIQHYTTLRTFK